MPLPRPEIHGEIDLRELTPCAMCGEPLLPGNPHFYRITLQSFIFDVQALNALAGTAQILGGTPQAVGIATALTDTRIAQAPVPAEPLLCHQDCVLHARGLFELLSVVERRNEKRAETERAAEEAAGG